MFDPVHNGHIDCAVLSAKLFGLEKVVFIPAGRPPHGKKTVASAEQRLGMLRIALENRPDFEISRVEIERETTAYTIDTVKELKQIYGDNLYFIIGMDAFAEIDTWKNAEELLQSVNFIVMPRSGMDKEEVVRKLQKAFKKQVSPGRAGDELETAVFNDSPFTVYLPDAPETDISSSIIRRRIQHGESIENLVPPGVEEYIKRGGVYTA
jgi:nicotinate-nucleotide adenylyltransferase